jgi:uncharacterized protein (DUF488 family)
VGASGTGIGAAALVTVGHGTAGEAAFAALLRDAGVERVVDVRIAPGSRRHPQFAREALERWLPAAGVDYRWEQRLGGRRRTRPGSPHVALQNAAFRGYADHMETPEFGAALADLLADARDVRTAAMCSESLWWRCHRRLIADAASLLAGVPVEHLGHDGRLPPHRPTEGVRRAGDGLVYDAGMEPLV